MNVPPLPSSHIVRSNALRDSACTWMYELIGAKKTQAHLPLPHPVSLERANFDELAANRGNDYVVGKKDDGIRYVLLLMTHPSDGEPIALMIDRFMHMFPIS